MTFANSFIVSRFDIILGILCLFEFGRSLPDKFGRSFRFFPSFLQGRIKTVEFGPSNCNLFTRFGESIV